MSSEEGKLFIGGLHWNTTTEGLKAYFEQFGQVSECVIMKDPSGRSRCFGFVCFSDPSVLDTVLQKTHILDKKQIDPKRAIPKNEQHPPTQGKVASKDDNKVFVGGIHVEADENEIREVFAQFDEVLEVVLMRDRETGRSRGFGFVTFASPSGAQSACACADFKIRGKRAEIKLAVPKGRASAMKVELGHQTYPASSGDPYAAWAEYMKAYPEYYEAMMKAYNNPAAMSAYYSQYYNQQGTSGQTQYDAVNPSYYQASSVPGNIATNSNGYGNDYNRGHGRRYEGRQRYRSRSRSRSPEDRRRPSRLTDRDGRYSRDNRGDYSNYARKTSASDEGYNPENPSINQEEKATAQHPYYSPRSPPTRSEKSHDDFDKRQ